MSIKKRLYTDQFGCLALIFFTEGAISSSFYCPQLSLHHYCQAMGRRNKLKAWVRPKANRTEFKTMIPKSHLVFFYQVSKHNMWHHFSPSSIHLNQRDCRMPTRSLALRGLGPWVTPWIQTWRRAPRACEEPQSQWEDVQVCVQRLQLVKICKRLNIASGLIAHLYDVVHYGGFLFIS